MKKYFETALGSLIGICVVLLVAIPLTIYDVYCWIEEWHQDR